jgi:hypothetical protein
MSDHTTCPVPVSLLVRMLPLLGPVRCLAAEGLTEHTDPRPAPVIGIC